MESTPLFQSRIGLGTWQMGEDPSQAKAECAAISHALAVGYRLIDTAEMYADGIAESLVGKALGSFASNRREEVTLVSKVLPHNANKNGTIKACEASLRRMQCDYLDHYLLHWQGSHSYESTIEGFLTLQERGLIRHFGVSNFNLEALKSWREAEENVGALSGCQSNQVYYALNERGIEFDLLPGMNTLDVALMAYSPLGTGNLAQHAGLSLLAAEHGLSAAQLALAWILRHPHAVAIPKSTHLARIEKNWQASQIQLSAPMLTQLDALFSAPTRASRLVII
jgi:diketogulonate reductase-like aldo/keto reductase